MNNATAPIAVIALSILLRLGIVGLQEYYRVRIHFFDLSVPLDIGVFVMFGLPLLEAVTLVAVLLPVSGRTEKIARCSLFLLPILMINATWRIFDYFQSYGACQTTSGGDFEGYCDTVGIQVFCHVPFLISGAAIALFRYFYKVSRP